MPSLIKQFNITGELQSNSIIAILGKSDFKTNPIDCLQAMVIVMKHELEPYVKELLTRSVQIVEWLL